MSIIDRFFVGKVIKNFGTLNQKSFGIGREKQSTLLVQRNGRYWFVVKSSYLAFFGASLHYQTIPLESAASIRDQLTESEQIVKDLPPLEYDASRLALLYILITFIVASTINLLAQDSGWVFLATFVSALIYLSIYIQFMDNPNLNSRTKKLLILLPLVTMLIAIPKFCLLTFAEWR